MPVMISCESEPMPDLNMLLCFSYDLMSYFSILQNRLRNMNDHQISLFKMFEMGVQAES